MARLSEEMGRKFLLFFGPFRFRKDDINSVSQALKKWCDESGTLGQNDALKTCKGWTQQQKRTIGLQVQGELDIDHVLKMGLRSGCGFSNREVQLMEAFMFTEFYMRLIASGNTGGYDVTFGDVFALSLAQYIERQAEDSDPSDDNSFEELKGYDDADCLVVDSLRDYTSLAAADAATVWPSDTMIERLEIAGTPSDSSLTSAYAVSASFPGELRLVIDWKSRSASLDVILIGHEEQSKICFSTDPTDIALTLFSCSQRRLRFKFANVVSSSKSLARRNDDLKLKGTVILSLKMSAVPTCTVRPLHSPNNAARQPCKSAPLPEELQGLSECTLTLHVPNDCGSNTVGPIRNRKLVERLVREMNRPEAAGQSSAAASAADARPSMSVREVLEQVNSTGVGTDMYNRLGAGRGEQGPVAAHPQDSLSGLPSFIFQEPPDTFVPRRNPTTGIAQNWGLSDGSWEENPMRVFEVQSLYSFGSPEWSERGPPELQYTRALLARKRRSMAEQLPTRQPLFAQDFVLRVALVRWPSADEPAGALRELAPSVWRRVVVSGGMALQSLHDRVLGPAMGWTRNYHGFLFELPSDGAVFAPQSSGAVDMLHIRHHCAASLPAEDCKVAQALAAPGEQLLYTYDLGDQWMHIITVEAVRPASESSGRAAVLAGAMACPPEDSMGLGGLGPSNYQKNVLQLDRELPASLQREIGRANNVNASAFDPHAFSLAEAEERVRGACAGKASVAGGELQYNMPLFGSQTVDLSGGLRQGKGIRVEQTAGSVVGAQSVRVPEARDPRGLRVCGPCGSPNGLKLCSACKTVAYCSAACQKEDWKAHKVQCRAVQAKKGAKK